ncbi:MAG: DeoR/GlpR transcriptional regulator [Oscillospiraceae bacterium]|nr:DeoR/GlpR transcriptional regulator [Oscillospiraceae bacterium]
MREERFKKILEILSDGKYVSVESLSKQLYVSMPTIRRDLTAMQEIGLVARSHGGAIRITELDSPPITFRIGVNSGEKIRLAAEAAKLIEDDAVIFMDESTTTLHLISHLPRFKNLKVVTNSMSVLQNLYRYKIQAYCLGGEFSRDSLSFFGREAESMVKRFGIDFMFFSSSAVNRKGWIADYSEPSNSLRRCVLEQADKKVFLCDKSKFGKHGAYTLAALSDMDYVILNSPLPESIDPGKAVIRVV